MSNDTNDELNIPYANTSFSDKTRDEIEQTKFHGEMGNAYVIKKPDGTLDWISKQSEVILLYEHELYDLIQGGSGTNPTIISESNPFVAIAPTSNKTVYTIWYDDKRPVQNPPKLCQKVLNGIIEGIERDQFDTIKDAYNEVRDKQVDVKKVNQILNQHEPLPPASVVPVEEGWVIEGTFLVTWEGSIYLRTQDTSEEYFYESGGYNSSSAPEILTIYPELPTDSIEMPLIRPESNENEETLEINDPERLNKSNALMLGFDGITDISTIDMDDIEMVVVDNDELNFLTKSLWLVNYRDNYEDDLFWDVIEKHVQTSLQEAASD